MVFRTALRLALGGGGRRKGTWRRLRGGIIGLALSLVPLTVVLHVSEGMIQGITARFLETGTGHIRIQTRRSLDYEAIDFAVSQLEGHIEGIRNISIEHQGIGLIRSDRGNSGVQIRGVPSDWYSADPGIRQYLRVDSGDFDLTGQDSLVLGLGLSEQLGVMVGDELRILTVRRGAAGGLLPRVTRFRVTGIVSSGYRDLDRLWAFIPLDRSRSLLPGESGNQSIVVKLDDPFILENPLITRDFQEGRKILGEIRARLSSDWRVLTWFELEQAQYMNFLGTKNMLVFIMVIILLVAGVNIASTMISLVTERQQEFAILQSLGAHPVTIGQIVLVIAGISGTAGIVLGLGMGTICVIFINEIILGIETLLNLFAPSASHVQIINPEFYLERIPVVVLPAQILVLGGAAGLISVISSLIPALKAARIRPGVLFRRD